ncbi:MAG: hypothetical protein HOI88_09045 [Phycisphaerae bacterium]|nr:hypothetical protein [Phycisphaerae bacterium]MBT6270473.1 hypothetical protein [Phycisphaerae bacterium]
MRKVHLFSIILALAVSHIASAQGRSINKIVDNNSLNDGEIQKIKRYAEFWSSALETTDGESLNNARKKLADPLEPSVGMTLYARSIYGNALKENIDQYLAADGVNEMAAVNALQVVSLLGTEEGCAILQNHADIMTEKRASLRLWSSIGLKNTFQIGVLNVRKIKSTAKLVATFIIKESDWFIISRQFDTLASIKDVPGLDKQAIEEMGIASFELQSTALATLLSDINTGDGADARVQALPIILPSLLLQFSESGVDDRSGDDAKEIILPELIAFVETSTSQAPSIEANPVLNSAYKEGVAIASIMINYILEQNAENSVTIVDLWENGNVDAIQECVKTWKKLSKN